MKKTLLLIIIILPLLKLAAQPKFTSANIPVNGDRFVVNHTGDIANDPKTAGANQLWDYRTTSFNVLYVDSFYVTNQPANTPGWGDFQGSGTNCVFIREDRGFVPLNTYSYYTLNNNSFVYNGEYVYDISNSTRYSEFHYSNPGLKINLPFSYGDSIYDAYESDFAVNYQNRNYKVTGYKAVKADGYGSVQLPGKLVNNVLRLHFSEYNRDSSLFNGDLRETYTSRWEWWTPYMRMPMLTILHDSVFVTENGVRHLNASGRFTSFTTSRTNPGLSMAQAGNAVLGCTVYPNPAIGDEWHIDFGMELIAPVELLVSDMEGKLIATKQLNASQNITLPGIKAGVYLFHFIYGNESYRTKVVKLY